MRLNEPVEFGAYIIEKDYKNEIKPDSFRLFMKNKEKKYIKLVRPLTIYVRYITCEGNESGRLTFYKDVYKKDKHISKQIFAKSM